MPIYEYECGSCGHRLEAIQSISEDPLSECPSCQEAALRRLLSAAAFRLKGGGWYETDFKKSDKRKNVAEGGSDSTAGGKSDSGSGNGSGGSSSSGDAGTSSGKVAAKGGNQAAKAGD